jgi:hypothetical protein
MIVVAGGRFFRRGRWAAPVLMKGSLHTDELMREVTSSKTGLRTARRIGCAERSSGLLPPPPGCVAVELTDRDPSAGRLCALAFEMVANSAHPHLGGYRMLSVALFAVLNRY